MKMNGRERLLAAIARKPVDRIPYTYDSTEDAERNFRDYLKIGDDESVGDFFGCDKFASLWSAIGAAPTLPERMERFDTVDPNVKVDIWGCRRELTTAGDAHYFEITEHPLRDAETIQDVENYDWPTVDDVVFPEIPADFDLERWKSDKVVLDMSFICPFGVPWSMMGLEKMMLDVALNPGVVEAVVAKVEEYSLVSMNAMLEKYPGVFDLVGCGDDYGTQNGLLMSAEMIGDFFMPSLKRHYDLASEYGVAGYHHCCGAIFEIIPSMMDAGVRVLNPIQTSAAGMDPEALKREFGSDLAFHGGVDIQQTLVTGTPDEVRAEARSRMETLGPEGYILAPSHVLQPDTPPENLAAMYDEVANWSGSV
ncbi:MAG: hypothetical protein GXP32_07140 [Kiritimatiellaeota bacterium]|nr:hypothetical protein [Kiritimatiellota bacterium]